MKPSKEVVDDQPRNSAARLLRLAEDYCAATDGNALNRWAAVFNIPPEDKPRLLSAIFSVPALVEQAKAEVRAIEGIRHENYLGWVPTYVYPFEQFKNFDSSAGHFASPFQQDIIRSLLPICVDQIRVFEPVLNDTHRIRVLHFIRKLIKRIQRITEEEMPSPLKRLVLRHLIIIEQSLIDYKVDGVVAVREATEQVVALAKLKSRELQSARSTKWWPRVRRVVIAYLLLVSAADQTIKLLESADDFLGITFESSKIDSDMTEGDEPSSD